MTTTTALWLRLPESDHKETQKELQYLAVLTAHNRGDLLTAEALQPIKRSVLGQWTGWRKTHRDDWTPQFTAIPSLTRQFLTALHAKRDKPSQRVWDAITASAPARENLMALIALDIYEDRWAQYVDHPTTIPFATRAAFVFTGLHMVEQQDRAYQHEAHGHWAKHGLPEGSADSDPPTAENPQARFQEAARAILQPLGQALQAVLIADAAGLLLDQANPLSFLSEDDESPPPSP